MIAAGRTLRAAQDAGTLYQVSHPQYAVYGQMFPWAETAAEAADGMNWKGENATFWHWYPAGTIFEVRRVLKAEIGCTWIAEGVATFRFERGEMTAVAA